VTNTVGNITQNLYSQNPSPDGTPAYGPQLKYNVTLPQGWTRVYAETYDDAGALVEDSINVLWTGLPTITLTGAPGSSTISHGGSLGPFTFTIMDRYGHPISSGTSISVSCNGANVSTDAPDIMKDVTTPGAGATSFTINLADGDGGTAPAVPPTNPLIVTVTHLKYGIFKIQLAMITIQ
jgi:hypothetical protein